MRTAFFSTTSCDRQVFTAAAEAVHHTRGALVDTAAVIEGLKNGHIGALGLDVYEQEADLFFEDLSNTVLHDDSLARVLLIQPRRHRRSCFFPTKLWRPSPSRRLPISPASNAVSRAPTWFFRFVTPR